MKTILFLCALALAATPALAKGRSGSSGGGSRPRYECCKHTESHGGSYTGGSSGSSHRGGTYNSPTGGHEYGKHK